jgi:UPF0716 protein FxsA
MLLFLLLWPFLEIFLFIKAVQIYGFFHVFMATLTAFFFGLLIVKAQGRTLLFKVQAELQQGKVPAQTLINSALLFIGGTFIMVPGFFSDIVGILLVLPGSRHLMSLYVRTYLARKISSGTFRVFNSGFGAGFGQGPSENNSQGFGTTSERDVSPRVIDVKPISSTEERE